MVIIKLLFTALSITPGTPLCFNYRLSSDNSKQKFLERTAAAAQLTVRRFAGECHAEHDTY